MTFISLQEVLHLMIQILYTSFQWKISLLKLVFDLEVSFKNKCKILLKIHAV